MSSWHLGSGNVVLPLLGDCDKVQVGPAVGLDVGPAVGPEVWRSVGLAVGSAVGSFVGAEVISPPSQSPNSKEITEPSKEK